MAGLGIYHYNARFYSPKLGRFLSADTIVPNPADPQHLNRFSYVANNPLKYIDPSGHRPCEDYQGSCVSEKQMTKIYKAQGQKIRDRSANKNKPTGGGDVNRGGAGDGIPVDIPEQDFVVGSYTYRTQDSYSFIYDSHLYSYNFDGAAMDHWISRLYNKKYGIDFLYDFGVDAATANASDGPAWVGTLFGGSFNSPSNQFTNAIDGFYFSTDRNGNFEVEVISNLAAPTTVGGWQSEEVFMDSGEFGVQINEKNTGLTLRMAISEFYYFGFLGTLNDR
jgi:RHS repeat-associated protein